MSWLMNVGQPTLIIEEWTAPELIHGIALLATRINGSFLESIITKEALPLDTLPIRFS